jgi:hypothetical protein
VGGRRPQCSAGHRSRGCTPAYLSTEISNLLQPAQAEVVLDHLSTYLASWVVIHKHFVGVKIPGFDLSNQFSGLTMTLLYRDGIHGVMFKKHKKFKLFK